MCFKRRKMQQLQLHIYTGRTKMYSKLLTSNFILYISILLAAFRIMRVDKTRSDKYLYVCAKRSFNRKVRMMCHQLFARIINNGDGFHFEFMSRYDKNG